MKAVLPPGRARFRLGAAREPVYGRPSLTRTRELRARPSNGVGRKARSRRSWGLNSNAARARSAEEGEDHMRQVNGTRGNLRGSALWGKPKGESRSSALWGKPGRGFAILALVAALAAPVAATAGETRPLRAGGAGTRSREPHGRMRGASDARSSPSSCRAAGGRRAPRSRRRSTTPRRTSPARRRASAKSFTSVNGVSAEPHGRADRRPGQAAGDPRDHARLPRPPLRAVLERPDLGRLGRRLRLLHRAGAVVLNVPAIAIVD